MRRIAFTLLALSVSCASVALAQGVNVRLADYRQVIQKKANSREIGRLGQATTTCPVYSQPDVKSAKKFVLKPAQFIVRDAWDSQWDTVLFEDGSYGFAPAKNIAKLRYTVNVTDSTNPSTPLQRARLLLGASVKPELTHGGFVKQVYRQGGIVLPGDLRKQMHIGQAIQRLEDLRPGDRLYFWNTNSADPSYAGIFLGNGYFMAPIPGQKTFKGEYLGQKRWLKTLVAARR